jgi:hypothetical protein
MQYRERGTIIWAATEYFHDNFRGIERAVVSRPGQAVEVEMWCVCVNICMNNGALMAVKELYIRLCAARDT